MQTIKRYLFLLFILFIVFHTTKAQTPVYNVYKDTLLILGEKVVDTYKILINREDFLLADTLRLNQKGLKVISFNMNALALGQNVTIKSQSGAITTEMKNQIVNEAVKYKFIYLKDILLQCKDGRTCYPSTQSIKIVFKN